MPRLRLPGGQVLPLPYDEQGGTGMPDQQGAPVSAGIERLMEMLGDDALLEDTTQSTMPEPIRRRAV